MRITKFGHSCLFIEKGSTRILIDPGSYVFKDTTLRPDDLPKCNILLLTHEHSDHIFPEALQIILKKSTPVILTNAGVQKLLNEQGIKGEVLKSSEKRV